MWRSQPTSLWVDVRRGASGRRLGGIREHHLIPCNERCIVKLWLRRPLDPRFASVKFIIITRANYRFCLPLPPPSFPIHTPSLPSSNCKLLALALGTGSPPSVCDSGGIAPVAVYSLQMHREVSWTRAFRDKCHSHSHTHSLGWILIR